MTDTQKERTKLLNMNTKITDKNLMALCAGEKDADLGLALPSMLGLDKPAASSGVKEELPSLSLVQEQLKALKRSYLLHTPHVFFTL